MDFDLGHKIKMYKPTKVSTSDSVSSTHTSSIMKRIHVTIVLGLCEFSFMFKNKLEKLNFHIKEED